jgi:uncharacterized OB-fold protein
MTDTVQKPLPEMSQVAKPFWEAAREGRFIIQKCAACGKHVFFPRIRCPHCSADQLQWTEASGRGTVYSYTVVVNNAPSAFINDMPYVVAIIRLDEGVQMLSNIVDCDPAEIHCDMPVEVTFEKLDDQFSLPKFKPIT